ncbi:MAG: formyltransferase family protein, partial [Gemmatimonadales bacterium]
MALETMIAAGFAPALVLTLPLSRRARHSDFVDLRPVAAAAGIDVVETSDVNSPETIAALGRIGPTHILVVGWSQLCREGFRRSASVGCLGYHPSALPAMRGRGVIPWTILSGVSKSAGSLFWLDEGMDSGDLAAQFSFDLPSRPTARSLYDAHLAALRSMLTDLLPRLAGGEVPRTVQDAAAASYCAKRVREDGWIEWLRSASEIDRLI